MTRIGLIREGKIPADNRVALTPAQCKWIHKNAASVRILAQHSDGRCFTDREYKAAGVEVKEDISDCDILLGIKEVPVDQLLPGKTYMFFSHTKKSNPIIKNSYKSSWIRKSGSSIMNAWNMKTGSASSVLAFLPGW